MKRILKWLGIAFIFLIAVGMMFNAAKSPEQKAADAVASELEANKQANAKREQAKLELVTLTSVSAADIASAYNENTVAADQQFKGKKFKVSGLVTDINTDFAGDPYIVLRGGVNQFMEPHFGFAKSDIAQLATLKKGTKITLVCIGKGDVAKTPMSGSCSIVGDDVAPSESANPIKRIPITPPEDSDVFINGRGQVLVSGSPNKRVLQCVQDRVDKEKKFTDGWDDQIVAECNKLKAP